ncbi:DUF4139 domain-containing protein [Dyadobacter beijingensis]|nr:DUF4139 domain-containing protein [Dyadobacter beijingensis]
MRIFCFNVFVLLFFISATRVMAQKSQVMASSVRQVTIYRNGAEVTRDVAVTLDEGLHELLFKGLSGSLEKESIRLSGLADLTVLSVLPKMNYNGDGEKSTVMKQLEARKDAVKEKLAFERGMDVIYKQEEEMLLKNQTLGGEKVVLKTLELKEAVDFQRRRLVEVLQKKLETANNLRKWADSLRAVNKALSVLQTELEKPTLEIAITVSVKKTTQAKLELSYYLANAGWYPCYDAKVADLSTPLLLEFKAGIFQYSGEDWKKVKIILSTANPKEKILLPQLKTWYWGAPNDYTQYRPTGHDNLPAAGIINEVSGFIRDEENQPLPGGSVVIKGTTVGTQADGNGFYQLAVPANAPLENRVLVFSYVGYKMQSKPISDSRMDVNMQPDEMALLEVAEIENEKGEKNADLRGRVAGVNVARPATIRMNTDEREAPTSVTYEIPILYTLISDGKTYTVDLKAEQLTDSYYEYVAVPKIRQEAFLNAYLPSWASLNLLPGDVNLYLENSYIGKTRLDLSKAADTLSLSFGIDKSVSVRREQVKTFTKKQFLGGNMAENRGYRITVRNVKRSPVRIVVKDQFPLAPGKDIDVFDKFAPEAAVNDSSGDVTWKFSLPAGESKELNLRYSVKYPKNGYLNGE